MISTQIDFGATAGVQLWLQNPTESRALFAQNSFRRLYHRATLRRFVGALLGRRKGLLDLHDLLDHSFVTGACDRGLVSVSIDNIIGSEGRSADFDCLFRPLSDHGCQRWHRIFEARLCGYPLPPVDLIQVGQGYFVRDGHHRISVARALGRAAIDATVKRWELEPRVINATQAWPAYAGREEALWWGKRI